MNEVSNDDEYTSVISSYYSLLKTSILRRESSEFIGGLPITLLRKHIFNILQPSKVYPGYSKYTVTSKVDGTRLLMFINEEDPNNPGFRQIHFIDRSMKIYVLSNKAKYTLPSIKGPKMIIDGELVFFKDKKSHYYLPPSDTEYLSFMAFDILYGPTDIKIEDVQLDIMPLYGSANSMIGPLGGKQWDYAKRLRILKNLIIPTKNNGNYPPLSLQFCDSEFFRIEFKQILYVSNIKNISDVESFIHNDFEEFRRRYYTFLNTKCSSSKINNSLMMSKLSYDGLIFTPIDTEYIIGNWNKFQNTQYKWKPTREQTIDFYVENTNLTQKLPGKSKLFKVVNLFIMSRGKLQEFDFDNSSVGFVDPRFEIKTGQIAEFGFSEKDKSFIFNRLRMDKDKPNAWRTAETVKDSIKYPVDINLISELQSSKSKELLIETADNYLKRKQLNRTLLCTGNLNIVQLFTAEKINELLKNNSDAEFEIRVGKIRGKSFVPGVSEDFFENTKKLFTFMNWSSTLSNYVDTFKDRVRTRYKYVPEISRLVKLESIVKDSLSNIDIDLNTVADFDIRFSAANENISSFTVEFKDATKIKSKDRISFSAENSNIRVDITEISTLILKGSNLEKQGDKEYQIEFEMLNNNYIEMINFLNYYISEIGMIWD